FQTLVKVFLTEQLTYTDGLAMRLTYEALEQIDEAEMKRIDQMLFVQNIPRETRVGTKQMGKRITHLSHTLYDNAWHN
ncbi:urease accessory protein UreF, partial [Staphylococcus equorum]|uniref:urease accessory protein UreF n=1 Tax=Staphylococcus equorum TaxID=246432 RepID=UPI003EC06BE0